MPNDDLPSIDPEKLQAVTGGTGTTDDAVTQMLQQLMSSIQDIAKNQSGGNNQLMQMLPIFMMMSQRNQAAPAPAPEPPPGDGWVRVA